MKDHIADTIEHLIWQFGLHDAPLDAVPMERLEPLFPLARRNLDQVGIAGMVILPEYGPISDTNFARVIVSDALDDDQERIVYAHEIAHAILGHEGELRVADVEKLEDWFADRAEHEAWEVAARLLIPTEAIIEFGNVRQIAMACRVPDWLVTLV